MVTNRAEAPEGEHGRGASYRDGGREALPSTRISGWGHAGSRQFATHKYERHTLRRGQRGWW